MTTRSFTVLSAAIFAVVAVLQLTRALFGWAITVDMGWGPASVPLWPNWVAFAVFALLAWLGFTASRS
jgi:hypothetical protein